MSATQPIEQERDSALDDDFGIDRCLRIISLFKRFYGKDPQTLKYLDELRTILLGIQERARARHQGLETQRLLAAERQDAANKRLEEEDTAQDARWSQFM